MEDVRRARLLLGPHGGAFANMVSASPGTQVIEFLPIEEANPNSDRALSMYWGLAQAAGHDYWTVEPSHWGFRDREISLDCDRVLATVDGALERCEQ